MHPVCVFRFITQTDFDASSPLPFNSLVPSWGGALQFENSWVLGVIPFLVDVLGPQRMIPTFLVVSGQAFQFCIADCLEI